MGVKGKGRGTGESAESARKEGVATQSFPFPHLKTGAKIAFFLALSREFIKNNTCLGLQGVRASRVGCRRGAGGCLPLLGPPPLPAAPPPVLPVLSPLNSLKHPTWAAARRAAPRAPWASTTGTSSAVREGAWAGSARGGLQQAWKGGASPHSAIYKKNPEVLRWATDTNLSSCSAALARAGQGVGSV